MSSLKEFAIVYTSFHDNLTKDEKHQIYEFIHKADADQVNYLLATGIMKESFWSPADFDVISRATRNASEADINKLIDFIVKSEYKNWDAGVKSWN